MRTAHQGDDLHVHFTGKLEDGTVFCSTADREPRHLRVGDGIGLGLGIPAIEEALVGMAAGERREVRVPADEAFGPYREDLVVTVERRRLPRRQEVVAGETLELPRPDGSTTTVLVRDVSGTEVTLDGNHPLAGKDVIFEIALVEIG